MSAESYANKRSRISIETQRDQFPEGQFFRLSRMLLETRDQIKDAYNSQADVEAAIISNVGEYLELPHMPANKLEAVAHDEYERLRRCISAADKAFTSYWHGILVEDLWQRTSVTNELSGVQDPAALVDVLTTTKDQRTRFEARRLLAAGLSFYEFEKYFGRERDLHDRLNEFEHYLNGALLTGERRDVALHHKLAQDDKRRAVPDSVRIPQFDETTENRQPGENIMHLSMRTSRLVDAQGNPIHLVEAERTKDRLSAWLKSIRKGIPIRTLRDVIGISLYVDNKDGDQLRNLVQAVERLLPYDRTDRDVHRLLVKKGDQRKANNGNRTTSEDFGMHKLLVPWDTQQMLEDPEQARESVDRFFGTRRLRDNFWDGVRRNAGKRFWVEVQIGEMTDLIDANLALGDINHGMYKVKQAIDILDDDAYGRNLLDMNFPQPIYNTDWHSKSVVDAIRRKRMAGLGVHSAVLEQLDKI